jgi:hypothetical protein
MPPKGGFFGGFMFPTLVYKAPGHHFGPSGKTYDYLAVKDQKALDKALDAGWTLDFQEALGLKEPEVVETPKNTELPEFEELIKQAEKLGIKVDKRWGAAKLAEMIGKT